ncbi:ankyrin repeat domain-containing protein [Paraglaciecola sp. 2405UD69-4]|uniref:ankyrin repeat domain-containing protein n=1 Tax=Paraglaciecola sp. 2405UD69-4 TaxID=3391836 RepID=UPI0039C8D752
MTFPNLTISTSINSELLATSIKLGIAALLLTCLVSCKDNAKPSLSNANQNQQVQQQLLLNSKQAILDLDHTLLSSLMTKIDVNQPLPDGSSLLDWAVETQSPKLVNLLLENGATVDITNGNRFKPIIQACRYGNSEIINALLDKGANPKATIEDGTSAFQLCAGSATSIDLARIANLGVDIDAQNAQGQTPIMWAANNGKVENLTYLVNQGVNINHQTKLGYSPLFFAIKSQNLNTIQAAIKHGADLFATAKDGTTAAQLAVYVANFEFLHWYISNLDSLMDQEQAQAVLSAFDRDGYQLLHAAVKANQPELVTKLIALGANPNTISEPSKLKWRYEANFKTESYIPPQLTPLEIAKQQKLVKIIEILEG